jgi:hypothetical protein
MDILKIVLIGCVILLVMWDLVSGIFIKLYRDRKLQV